MGESQLKEIFPDDPNKPDKFTSSIMAIRDVYNRGNTTIYPGAEELVISTSKIRWNKLRPWSIQNGILQKNGAPVIIDGLPVKVEQL